jgi:hypothetical protein
MRGRVLWNTLEPEMTTGQIGAMISLIGIRARNPDPRWHHLGSTRLLPVVVDITRIIIEAVHLQGPKMTVGKLLHRCLERRCLVDFFKSTSEPTLGDVYTIFVALQVMSLTRIPWIYFQEIFWELAEKPSLKALGYSDLSYALFCNDAPKSLLEVDFSTVLTRVRRRYNQVCNYSPDKYKSEGPPHGTFHSNDLHISTLIGLGEINITWTEDPRRHLCLNISSYEKHSLEVYWFDPEVWRWSEKEFLNNDR